jgi:hypothetical protein
MYLHNLTFEILIMYPCQLYYGVFMTFVDDFKMKIQYILHEWYIPLQEELTSDDLISHFLIYV